MALRIINIPVLSLSSSSYFPGSDLQKLSKPQTKFHKCKERKGSKVKYANLKISLPIISAALPPLDLTEDNIRLALEDARAELIYVDVELCNPFSVGTNTPHILLYKHERLNISFMTDVAEIVLPIIEFPQIFDTTVGMTGKVDLADLDGPFVKISLKGRFWHERSLVLARISNYLKIRIPEILEVDIEDEKQLDDSPANF